MLPEVGGFNRHTVPADVVGACHRKVDIAAAAHVAKARKCGFSRDGCNIACAFLNVCGTKAAQNFHRNLRVQFLKLLKKRCKAPRGKTGR